MPQRGLTVSPPPVERRAETPDGNIRESEHFPLTLQDLQSKRFGVYYNSNVIQAVILADTDQTGQQNPYDNSKHAGKKGQQFCSPLRH
jgi:hypothetical protein